MYRYKVTICQHNPVIWIGICTIRVNIPQIGLWYFKLCWFKIPPFTKCWYCEILPFANILLMWNTTICHKIELMWKPRCAKIFPMWNTVLTFTQMLLMWKTVLPFADISIMWNAIIFQKFTNVNATIQNFMQDTTICRNFTNVKKTFAKKCTNVKFNNLNTFCWCEILPFTKNH